MRFNCDWLKDWNTRRKESRGLILGNFAAVCEAEERNRKLKYPRPEEGWEPHFAWYQRIGPSHCRIYEWIERRVYHWAVVYYGRGWYRLVPRYEYRTKR